MGTSRCPAVVACLAFVVAAIAVLLSLGQAPADAAFPGENGQIAFVTSRDGNLEIYVMNADGSAQTNLTESPTSDEIAPAWSPDGSRIAFTSNRDGNLEVYVMDATGWGVTRLTNNPAVDSNPTWSPDGSQLAFVSNRDGNSEIYVMDADGSAQTNITNDPENNSSFPAWSPIGGKIAFHRITATDRQLCLMNADGSGQTVLVDSAGRDGFPDWSPDGSNIAFSSDRDGNDEIYALNAGGGGQIRLTNNSASDRLPAWSPDGTKIAFMSDRDGNLEIHVMDADGSDQINLTNDASQDIGADWQPLSLQPTPTPTPTLKDPAGDTDGDTILNGADPNDDNDGCSDAQELGANEALGGLRDPHNFWDWYDPSQDGSVTVSDFFALLQRFGSVGDTGLDPLSEPNPAPAYHTRFDRGPVVGEHPWSAGPPDGAIVVTDFFALLAQFGHTCADTTTSVSVELLDSLAIDAVPNTAPPGQVTFGVSNAGIILHDFWLIRTNLAVDALPVVGGVVDKGQLDVVASTVFLNAGENQDVAVNLAPGDYVLICNVPGHYLAGMRAPFTVE